MGPLDHPGLRLVEEQIERGDLQRAQQLLARLDDSRALRHGISYLATRLLFERGRLDKQRVIERLRDLVKHAAPFPEAEAMLRAAENGTLRRTRSRMLEAQEAPDAEQAKSIEQLFKKSRSTAPSLPSIPKAPALPNFTPSPDRSPSYAPPESEQEPVSSRRPGVVAFARAQPTLNAEEREMQTTRPPREEAVEIRSGRPPAFDDAAAPSVIDIAALLDEARFEEALNCLERSTLTGPDQQLLRARALHGQGWRKQALAALEPLCQAPLLEPELRGSCARLLVELDELDRAIEQGERAHHDDPDSPFLRLTLAWSKLRALRRSGERRLVEEAQTLLDGIQARNLPLPALVLALRACVQAHAGDAERAIALAQRALSLDSRAPDALWAMSIGSARLRRQHDAKQAFLRLLNLNLDEARLLRKALQALGAPISDAPRALDLEFGSAAAFWHPLENMLVNGERAPVIIRLDELCRERLGELTAGGGRHDFSTIAEFAAGLFTTLPVFHHFAPFDHSLWSVPRVAAALDVLYGTEPLSTPLPDSNLVLLIGAYLGEVLRGSRGGTWSGAPDDLSAVSVNCEDTRWRPFELVFARLRRGLSLSVEQTIALTHPGADPWNQRVQTSASPPLPWAPRAWPEPSTIEQLGRSVVQSVIGVYCRDIAQSPLDWSFASLRALDQYLSLVAPLKAPPDDDPVFARRLAVLLGAYLGETLREAAGGHWLYERCAHVEADAYVMKLADVRTATPLTQVMARVIGDSEVSIVEYAGSLLNLLEE
jgi:tetratricopeptide (TPR) repeat protein